VWTFAAPRMSAWNEGYNKWFNYNSLNFSRTLSYCQTVRTPHKHTLTKSTRSSAVAKRPRDASCLYSFNAKRRAQSFLLLVVSASDTPLRTIVFCSLLFGVLVHAAGRHEQTFAGAIYTAWSSVTVFDTSSFARPAIDR